MYTSGTPPEAAILKAWLSPNMAAASDIATFGHVVANKELHNNSVHIVLLNLKEN